MKFVINYVKNIVLLQLVGYIFLVLIYKNQIDYFLIKYKKQ